MVWLTNPENLSRDRRQRLRSLLTQPIRRGDVPYQRWLAISWYVSRGFVEVRKEYGVPVARLTERGREACCKRLPGPKPANGQSRRISHEGLRPIPDNAHWLVKLIFARVAELGMSINQLAKLSGESGRTLQEWRLGTRNITVLKAENVLNALGINLAAGLADRMPQGFCDPSQDQSVEAPKNSPRARVPARGSSQPLQHSEAS